MDIDGLAALMEANKKEMIRQFEDMKKHCCEVTKACNVRIENIEDKVDSHDTTLDKMKGVGMFMAFVWTAFIAWATHTFWGD